MELMIKLSGDTIDRRNVIIDSVNVIYNRYAKDSICVCLYANPVIVNELFPEIDGYGEIDVGGNILKIITSPACKLLLYVVPTEPKPIKAQYEYHPFVPTIVGDKKPLLPNIMAYE